MAKHVELEDVIQRLDNAIYCANHGEFDSYLEAMKRLRIAYDETMPTIEIVRCKDCIRAKSLKCPFYRAGYTYNADGYCSEGVRKDNE